MHFNNYPYVVPCSTGNQTDGCDTDEVKQFIATTNKKAAIKVNNTLFYY